MTSLTKPPSEGVGARIRELRERRGYTQSELARRIGKHPGDVNRWEMNRVRPGYGTAMKLGEALGVDVAVVMGERDIPDQVLVDPTVPEAEENGEDALWKDEDQEWIAGVIETTRFASGRRDLPAEQLRLLQIDILEGFLRHHPAAKVPEHARRLREIQDRLRAGHDLDEEYVEASAGMVPEQQSYGGASSEGWSKADVKRELERISAMDVDPYTRMLERDSVTAMIDAEGRLEAERGRTEAERAARARAEAARARNQAASRRAEIAGARLTPGFVISELSEDERRRFEFWKREQGLPPAATSSPAEGPGSRPEGRPRRAGA